MPNRDKTGPQGKGPRTGRGKGNCKPVKGVGGFFKKLLKK